MGYSASVRQMLGGSLSDKVLAFGDARTTVLKAKGKGKKGGGKGKGGKKPPH